MKAFDILRPHASKILTGVAIAGVAGTGILSAKAGRKVERELQKADVMSEKEEVELYLKSYAPPVVTGLATTAAIVGIEVLGERKAAALMAAYGLVQNSYNLYRQKNIDIYGREADTTVIHAMESSVVNGDYGYCYDGYYSYDDIDYKKFPRELFYEPITGTLFWSCMPAFLNARYHLQILFDRHGFASLGEFLELLGVGPKVRSYPREDDELGWSCDYLADMTGDYVIEISADEYERDGKKVREIAYALEPVTNYDPDHPEKYIFLPAN